MTETLPAINGETDLKGGPRIEGILRESINEPAFPR